MPEFSSKEGRGVRRIAREECEPGDWVEASMVPGWSLELPRHQFAREGVSISPDDGGLGGIRTSSVPEKWIFVAAVVDGRPVWQRES